MSGARFEWAVSLIRTYLERAFYRAMCRPGQMVELGLIHYWAMEHLDGLREGSANNESMELLSVDGLDTGCKANLRTADVV